MSRTSAYSQNITPAYTPSDLTVSDFALISSPVLFRSGVLEYSLELIFKGVAPIPTEV